MHDARLGRWGPDRARTPEGHARPRDRIHETHAHIVPQATQILLSHVQLVAGQLNSTCHGLSVGRVHYECTCHLARHESLHMQTAHHRPPVCRVLTSPTASRRASGPFTLTTPSYLDTKRRGCNRHAHESTQKEAWHNERWRLACVVTNQMHPSPLDPIHCSAHPSPRPPELTWLRLPHPNRAIR